MDSTMSGAVNDDWIEKERKHEREMRRLALEEQKREDGHKAWKAEEFRVRLAIFFGIVGFVAVVITIVVMAFGQASENSKLDHERRLTCLEQGGSPIDNATNSTWTCLYLQKERDQ